MTHELSNPSYTETVLLLYLQAGEFFHAAQRSALSQHREAETQLTEESLDTPLLLDQVDLICSFVYWLHLFCLPYVYFILINNHNELCLGQVC